MKLIRIHKAVKKNLDSFDILMKQRLTEVFGLLAAGENIGLPLSRPMPIVDHGCHEIRIKDRSGQYRIFYYTKMKDSILIFHFFKKKTQETPKNEIATAKIRLKEML